MSRLLKQKVSSIFALSLAVTIMFTMCFATTALANNGQSGSGSPISDPDEVQIEKILQMPEGTTTPDVTFEFEAKKVSLDGISSSVQLAMMPELNIADNGVSYDSNDTATPEENTISIAKLTNDLLVNFPGAGVYEYEISEKNTTFTNTDDEILAFSKAVYTLQLYVTNNQSGGTDISAASIIVKTADNSEQTVGDKVEQMTFTNSYVKTNAPEIPENPDPLTEGTLEISNTVSGGTGNKAQYFDFSITPDVHELFEELGVVGDFFRAYIVENDSVVNDITPNLGENGATGTDTGGKKYIEIKANGETSFKLKDGQKLVFVDTPVGTGYEAKETIVEGYTVSHCVTTNGNVGGTETADIGDFVLSTGPQIVGEAKNCADFTNYRDAVAPTGVSVNNLPFIGLILLPVAALALYVAFKVRRNRQEA